MGEKKWRKFWEQQQVGQQTNESDETFIKRIKDL